MTILAFQLDYIITIPMTGKTELLKNLTVWNQNHKSLLYREHTVEINTKWQKLIFLL